MEQIRQSENLRLQSAAANGGMLRALQPVTIDACRMEKGLH
jgi:hypothetical protein